MRETRKKIMLKKAILNFLLGYFSPSNKIIIYISQNLDKSVSNYQKILYKKYRRRILYKPLLSKFA